jgi:hypothetical protein
VTASNIFMQVCLVPPRTKLRLRIPTLRSEMLDRSPRVKMECSSDTRRSSRLDTNNLCVHICLCLQSTFSPRLSAMTGHVPTSSLDLGAAHSDGSSASRARAGSGAGVGSSPPVPGSGGSRANINPALQPSHIISSHSSLNTFTNLSLEEYIKAKGGNRLIQKILIANNGIAAVKAIRSMRR